MSEENEQSLWTDWTPEKEAKFIKSLVSTGGNIARACRAAKVARSTVYDHKKKDPAFAQKWSEAVEQGIDELEQEARRRAFSGTEKPVFYKGDVVGHINEYSDTLMIFLLKGNRPEKYKERHEHTGKDGKPIEVATKVYAGFDPDKV